MKSAVASVFGFRRALVIAVCMAASGCGTFIGVDHPAMRQSMDFGPPQTVNMCVLLDKGVSPDDAAALLSTWNEEGSKYGLYVKAASYQELPRTGFFHSQIMDQLNEVSLPPSCDRMIYFVNRDAGDFLYGLATISL